MDFMTDNSGVDVKPIVSPSQMKNMWEQNILKKKQEVEEARKVGALKVPSSPVKPLETKPPVQQPPSVSSSTQTPLMHAVQITTVHTTIQRLPASSTNSNEVQPIHIVQKTQSAVDTTGMSLKQRMKVWQQVTSSKSEGAPSPLVANKPPPPQPVTKPIQVKPQPPSLEPIKPVEVPKPLFIAPVSPPPPVQQPVIQTPTPQSSSTSSQTVKPGGVETSFVPASKRIGIWQTQLNKNNSEAKKAKEENVFLAKANARLSYQPQTSSSEVTDKISANERATYIPQSQEINLQEILGTAEEKSPAGAFHKKPSETPAEGEPILSVKQRMKLMQHNLEKSLKQKQLYTLVNPVPQQPPSKPREVEGIQLPTSDNPSVEQTPALNARPEDPLPELSQANAQVAAQPATSTQINAQTPNTESEFSELMARQARMKNRRAKVDFDEA